MITLQDNEDAFKRYKLRPRIMKNVDGCDMSSSIFGQQVKAPFGFAPSAAHKLAHPQGELATSRAAAANDIPMCLSSWATTSLEDVKNAGGSNPHAMQVTFMRDVSFTQKVIKRSEAAGYNAIFVSVDLPVLGNRLNESRNDFCFPTDMPFPNLPFDSGDSRGLISTGDLDYDPSIHWEQTVPWLREQTNMDVWLKGGMPSSFSCLSAFQALNHLLPCPCTLADLLSLYRRRRRNGNLAWPRRRRHLKSRRPTT